MISTTSLIRNWINGNRKDVINEILAMPVARAAASAAKLCILIPKEDRQTLLTMLENRFE